MKLMFMKYMFMKLMRIALMAVLIMLTGQSFSDTLKVATYNTNLLPNLPITSLTSDLNLPDKRAMLIPEHFRDYDIVVFQELTSNFYRSQVTEAMKAHGFQASPVIGAGLEHWEHLMIFTGGVVIYSRHPILKTEDIVYSRADGLEGLSSKGVAYVKLDWHGQSVHVFATHTQSIRSNVASDRSSQKKEIKQFRAFIDKIDPPTSDPVLLLGDFNLDSGSAFSRSQDKVHSVDYQEALQVLNAKQAAPYGASSESYSYDVANNTMAQGNWMNSLFVDHILCLKSHKCPSHGRVYAHKLIEPSLGNAPDLSDHYPLTGELEY